jgi:small subunit ribosomal protein S10
MSALQQLITFERRANEKKTRSFLPEYGIQRFGVYTTVTPQKLRIILKAYESSILDDTCRSLLATVKPCGVETTGPIPLPTKLRRYCVLTSPHVNKKARDHFEIRTHKRIVDILKPTDHVLESLKHLNISVGVDVEVKNF